jgi:poly-gamma-glutamate synthesis protein (capsule biosynthesis protein)
MEEKEKDNTAIVIGFTGDVMIGRNVNEQIAKTNYAYPWGNVLPELKSTDLTIINLETTLTTSTHKVYKTFNFKARPEYVEVLSKASIDLVNLANNHILDFGVQGLTETIQVLDHAGIRHVGAGANLAAASKAEKFFKNDLWITVVGFTDNEPGWHATDTTPGTNYIAIEHNIAINDIEAMKKNIEALKRDTNLLIVSIHWGPNMRERPNKAFIDFAHSLIDSGVDILHGHSAHIFQGIEWYRKKLILYDTGDFIDDYRVDPELKNDHSFLFMCTVDKKGIRRLQLIPVLIADMQVNLATGAEYDWCIQRMRKLCAPFKTTLLDNGEVVVKE